MTTRRQRHQTDESPGTALFVRRVFCWLNDLLLRRTVLVLTVLIIAAGGFLLWHQSDVQDELVKSMMLEDAKAYSDALATFRSLYTSEVVETVLKQNIVVTHDYDPQKGEIPLPATLSMKLGEHMGENGSQVRSKLYSPYPFRGPRKVGELPDKFGEDAWAFLTKNPEKSFSRFEEVDGRLWLRYATADLMRKGCIHCHNTHPDTPKSDWKLDDVRGVLEVALPMDTAAAATRSGFQRSLFLFSVFGGIGVAGLALVIGRLRRTSHELEDRVQRRTSELSETNTQLTNEITERAQAQKALIESGALYRSLVDNLPIHVTRKDVDGRITYVNQAFCDLLSMPADDILGKTDHDFFPTELADKYRRDDKWVIETGNIFEDVEENRSDGQRRFMELRKAPVRDADGEIVGTQTIFWDVTQRKLAQEALLEAKESAEFASRAKSDFLANMSHEIRTPLNAVIGMTELVLGEQLTTSQREYLEMVKESGESLLAIINDMLDFSKIEAGKLELFPVDFNLRDRLARTVKPLKARARGKSVELELQVSQDVPDCLTGDFERLRQVIVNLVGNAIKFTDEGEVLLGVDLESQADNQTVLRFSVADTGVGIPQDKIARVFDAFEQADNSLTRRHAGTGLGLTISSRLVELLGGRIWVESELGKGSRFQFTACFQLRQASTTTSHKNEQLSEKPSLIKPLKILLAEDSPTNQKLTVGLLSQWGHKVTVAQNGFEAIALFQQQEFDLLLMDVQMPEMDGLQATAAIREKETPSDHRIPIIALTAHAMPEDRKRCLDAGMDGYVTKPISQQALQDAIESFVNDSRSHMENYSEDVP